MIFWVFVGIAVLFVVGTITSIHLHNRKHPESDE
jgi:hypothetical protein